MIRFITLIILILSFYSCTITKRVHRKGWHVEWNSSQRIGKKSMAETPIHGSENIELAKKELIEPISSNQVNGNDVQVIDERVLDTDIETISHQEQTNNNQIALSVSEKNDAESVRDNSIEKKSVLSSKPEDRDGLFKASIIFTILFVLSLILTLALYFSLSSSVGLGSAIITLFGIGLFGIFALVFAIMSLITLIGALAS